MTIEEFYALAGGDAADTLRRLGSEATVRRFALRSPRTTAPPPSAPPTP